MSIEFLIYYFELNCLEWLKRMNFIYGRDNFGWEIKKTLKGERERGGDGLKKRSERIVYRARGRLV